MREETGEWLEPMLTEANARGIDLRPLMRQATMPVAESDNQFLEELATVVPAVKGIDWVRYGQLLCHELGWCETYPPIQTSLNYATCREARRRFLICRCSTTVFLPLARVIGADPAKAFNPREGASQRAEPQIAL